MTDRPRYAVVCVGGGPAGMTTALYTTRLGHPTAVFEKAGGRHSTAAHVHNLYGVSEAVSGHELAVHARNQLAEYGGEYYREPVHRVARADDSFIVESTGTTVEADRVVFATGFTDDPPSVPGLQQFVGRGLHYCLHCDAYTLGDGPVYVLGYDDRAATVAMLMLNFTADVDLLLDDTAPEWEDEIDRQLDRHPVDRIDASVTGTFPENDDVADPWLGGLVFEDGREREYLGGFAMYGKAYNTTLADSIGCERTDDGAVAVDEHGETSVDGVYAVGDVTHGQNQTAIASADGATTGIALHKELRRFPLGPDDEMIEAPAVPAVLRRQMRRVRAADRHAGLSAPAPDEE